MEKKLLLIYPLFLTMAFCLFQNGINAQHFALSFDGTSNFITVDSTLGSEIRTIEFWFKPTIDYDSTNQIPATFIYRDTPDQNEEFGLYIGPDGWEGQAGRIVFDRRVGASLHKIVSDQNHWIADRWYHVAGVIHPVDGMQLYINGILQNDSDTSVMPTTYANHPLSIGAWNNTGLRLFSGQMDDLRLWYYERSAADIEAGMYQPVAPQTDGLLAYWNFNNNTDSLTIDMTNNSFDLSIENTGITPTNSGLLFSESEATVNLEDSIGNGIRSISLWFKLLSPIDSSLAEPQTLIYRNATPNLGEFGLYFGASNWAGKEGRLTFTRALGADFYHIVSDENTWESHRWYHVLATIDPQAGMRMYIDKALQTDQLPSTEPTQSTEDITSIGKWGDADIRYFNGFIDDLLLWEQTIRIEELETSLCDTLTIDNDSPLRAFFHLNENEGSIVQNQLDSLNSYTISGDTSWLEIRNCSMTIIDNTSPISTSTNEIISTDQTVLNVFPNPSSGKLSVDLPANIPGPWELSIHTTLGKSVYKTILADQPSAILNPKLAQGIYYLSLSSNTNNATYAKKIIIQ